jgi:hypothetical protein
MNNKNDKDISIAQKVNFINLCSVYLNNQVNVLIKTFF